MEKQPKTAREQNIPPKKSSGHTTAASQPIDPLAFPNMTFLNRVSGNMSDFIRQTVLSEIFSLDVAGDKNAKIYMMSLEMEGMQLKHKRYLEPK